MDEKRAKVAGRNGDSGGAGGGGVAAGGAGMSARSGSSGAKEAVFAHVGILRAILTHLGHDELTFAAGAVSKQFQEAARRVPQRACLKIRKHGDLASNIQHVGGECWDYNDLTRSNILVYDPVADRGNRGAKIDVMYSTETPAAMCLRFSGKDQPDAAVLGDFPIQDVVGDAFFQVDTNGVVPVALLRHPGLTKAHVKFVRMLFQKTFWDGQAPLSQGHWIAVGSVNPTAMLGERQRFFPLLEEVFVTNLGNLALQGVSFSQDEVPEWHQAALNAGIDALVARKGGLVQYHPGSNNKVLDIVHPIDCHFNPAKSEFEGPLKKSRLEMWNIPRSPSGRHWLPTWFDVSSSGQCKAKGYINGLDAKEDAALIGSLEQLLSIALPHLETVAAFAMHVELFVDGLVEWNDYEDSSNQEYSIASLLECYSKLESPDERMRDMIGRFRNVENGSEFYQRPVNLRATSLQVITKIVDYELGPGESYEGVWHTEGMADEAIISTAVFTLDRGADLVGGDISFKVPMASRAFHVGAYDVSHKDDVREDMEFLSAGFEPVGSLGTPKGRLTVFPNCHVHKVNTIVNLSETEKQKRRIVVFWLVNPVEQIMSTSEVTDPRKAAVGAEAHNATLEDKLSFMQERAARKVKLNPSGTVTFSNNLCEH